MSTLQARVRRRLPKPLLEKFYVGYWRQHKEDYIANLDHKNIFNANIRQNAYELRRDFYKALYDRFFSGEPLTFLEFGVYRGDSILTWADLDSHPDSAFIGFDTFTGLPEDWKAYQAGHFSTEGAVPPTDDDRVAFVPGLFQKTLHTKLASMRFNRQLLVHIDSDLYSAALYILSNMQRYYTERTFILFDQWCDVHEYRAFQDYTESFMVGMELCATMNDNFSKVMFRVNGQIG